MRRLAEEAGFYEQRLYRDQAGIDYLLDGLHKAGMPQEQATPASLTMFAARQRDA